MTRVKSSKRRLRSKERAARAARRIACVRKNWHHHVSRRLTDSAHTIVIEALRPKAMTAAGGAHKRGLNRVIRETGWGDLRRMLEYKAGAVVTVNPAYTSQTCAVCGNVDARSRRTQAVYLCVACGYVANADLNAARNILAAGSAAAGRGEAFGLPTSAIRQSAGETRTVSA